MQGVGGTIGEEGIRTLGDGNMKPGGQKLKIDISIKKKKKKKNAKFIITNMAELQTLQEDNLQEGAQFSQFQNKRQTKIWFYQVS